MQCRHIFLLQWSQVHRIALHLWPHNKCYILLWTPTFIVPLSALQGCVITFSYIPLIELFVYFDLPTCPVSCSSECRSAAEPGSFYLVPGSLHQIFCYISIKNTPNLFDSFYSVFFKVTFSNSRWLPPDSAANFYVLLQKR